MFRPLLIILSLALLLVPGTVLAQQEGQVKRVRRAPAQSVESVQGEPVQTVSEIRPLEEGSAGALLAELAEAFLGEDARGLSAHMAEPEIPFSLEADQESGDPSLVPRQSREQIYYLLRDYFERVWVRQVECDCSEENLGLEDAYGVLELGLEDSARSRLFVRLRRADELWRVVEIRALP